MYSIKFSQIQTLLKSLENKTCSLGDYHVPAPSSNYTKISTINYDELLEEYTHKMINFLVVRAWLSRIWIKLVLQRSRSQVLIICFQLSHFWEVWTLVTMRLIFFLQNQWSYIRLRRCTHLFVFHRNIANICLITIMLSPPLQCSLNLRFEENTFVLFQPDFMINEESLHVTYSLNKSVTKARSTSLVCCLWYSAI